LAKKSRKTTKEENKDREWGKESEGRTEYQQGADSRRPAQLHLYRTEGGKLENVVEREKRGEEWARREAIQVETSLFICREEVSRALMDWERKWTHECPPNAIEFETSSQTRGEKNENNIDRRPRVLKSFSNVLPYY
jgi:hypothetical protein